MESIKEVKDYYHVTIACTHYVWNFEFIGKLEYIPAEIPKEWGQACFLKLTPKPNTIYPPVLIEIPDGATPVLHTCVRCSMLDGSMVRKLCAGYRIGNTRYMHVIDINGNTSYETDSIGI